MAARKTRPIAARFWAKVDTSAGPYGCWPWTGALSHGYGVLARGGRSEGNVPAHQVALSLVGRPVAVGQEALHSCDNPPCVNPRHLRPGTRTENILDSVGRGRWNHPGLAGERHHQAKLTSGQVEAIRGSTEASGSIARRLGVTASHVRRIRRGRCWAVAA